MKSLRNLLVPSGQDGLGEIVRHARNMGEMAQILEHSLPGEAAGSIQAANVRDDGELVILASSPAWAAKLRFEADSLLQAARRAGADVTRCTVRVSRS